MFSGDFLENNVRGETHHEERAFKSEIRILGYLRQQAVPVDLHPGQAGFIPLLDGSRDFLPNAVGFTEAFRAFGLPVLAP